MMPENRKADAPVCVTIDVEEAFHIEAARGVIHPADWPRLPRRVEQGVDVLLQQLDHAQVRATCFILGDVARATPRVVHRIANAGHEIACHGDAHQRLHRLNPRRFAADLQRAKATLEDLAGQCVIGYRAPSFSLTRATGWAVDVLLDQGFLYDASVFPVRHPHYGVPDAPDHPFHLRGLRERATLLELPPLTWHGIAVAGGGYFRLLPLAFMQAGLRRAAQLHRPAILYFHPWEFDVQQPRLPLPPLQALRTYTGIGRAARRLERILATPRRWMTLAQLLPIASAIADVTPTLLLNQSPLVRETPLAA